MAAERRDNQTGSNAINICVERGVGHFDQIPPNQRSRCLQFSRLILLLRFGSRNHSPFATRRRAWRVVMCRAYIFMPPLRRTRDGCLRLIRRSKVVSYGKPWKDLLILDGRVRQHLIPCPAANFNCLPLFGHYLDHLKTTFSLCQMFEIIVSHE